MSTQTKPAIPEHFYRKSLLGSIGFIGYMLAMFLLPSWLAYVLLLQSSLPLALSLLLCVPLFFLAGQGMHLMGWLGHDGLHFNLHENRIVSSILGIVFSAPTGTFVEMGMALDHWTHHRYTNLPEDPDLKMFEGFHGFWSRMLLSRAHCNKHYVRRVYKLATNQPLAAELQKIILPFSRETLRKLAIFNLCMNGLFLALYISIAIISFKVFLIFLLAPMITGSLLSGMRPYIEHNGTSAEEHANTRTRTSFWWTLLDFGGNFHHEHHLYPGVPQWRLPALHRYLVAQGFDFAHQDGSFIRHYKYLRSQYNYPTAAPASAG